MLEFPLNYIFITQLYNKGVHNGVDIIGNNKEDITYIIAPGDGIVESVRSNYDRQDSSGSSYGNYVKIDHGNGFKTLVAHLKYNSVKVRQGEKVSKGAILGIMGTTGHSTGVHVHYEVFKNNVKVNPLDYTYANSNQIIHNKSIPYIKLLKNNSRDKSKNQLLVVIPDLYIRKGPGLNYETYGFAIQNNYYDYYDYYKDDIYEWYKIGDNKWIANDGSYLKVFNKEEVKNIVEHKFVYEVNEDNFYLIKLYKGEKLIIE